MNILVLDEDPIMCAEYHSDRDVSKKILEYSELMTMAHVLLDGKLTASNRLGMLIPYGGRKFHHVISASWVRATSGNYQWLHSVTAELIVQFKRRFGHGNSYADIVEALRKQPLNIPFGELQRFAYSVPTYCRRGADAVAAYRAMYNYRHDKPVWREPARVPEWYRPVEMAS